MEMSVFALISMVVLIAALGSMPRSCSAGEEGLVQVKIDCRETHGPLVLGALMGVMSVHRWEEGHPTRKAWEEVGFRHVRGYYLEPTVEVRPEESGAPQVEIDFTNADYHLAHIKSLGIEPVFLIGTTPRGLSSKPDANEWPKDHYSQYAPADYGVWEEYVEKLVKHLMTEWGHAGAYYEVWNEPECYDEYWRGAPGSTDTMADYVRLYLHTSRAVKAADPTAKVGGPVSPHWKGAELGAGWGLEGVMRLLRQHQLEHPDEKIAMDFISWHDYAWVSPRMLDGADHVDNILAEIGWPDRPEYSITEWNLSFGSDNDGKYTAQQFASHAAYNLITIAGERPRRITGLYYYLFDKDDGKYVGMVDHDALSKGAGTAEGQTGELRPAYAVYQILAQLDGGEVVSAAAQEPVVALSVRQGSSLLCAANNNSAEEVDVVFEVEGAGIDGKSGTARLQRVDEEHSSDGNGLESGVPVTLTVKDGGASLATRIPAYGTVLLRVEARQ